MKLSHAEQDHLIRILRRAVATDELALKFYEKDEHFASCDACRIDFLSCCELTKAMHDRLNAEILTR